MTFWGDAAEPRAAGFFMPCKVLRAPPYKKQPNRKSADRSI